MKSLLCTAAVLALACTSSPGEIRRVIHITVDGLRGDLLKNLIDTAPATYPNFKRLRDEGAVTFNARCDFDYSETIPNHSSVVTGRPVINPAGLSGVGHAYTSNGYTGTATSGDSIHQLGTAAYLYKASTFDMAHDRGLSTAIYGGKSRLNLYVHSYNATKGRADTTGADNGKNKIDFASVSDVTSAAALPGVKNALVADITSGALRRYSLVHFTDTDTGQPGGGHGNGWGSAAWNTAVASVDGYLGAIMSALSEASPDIAGKTAIVLTADHGGGGGGSGPGSTPDKNHGDASSVLNYTIPVILWGPGIPGGTEAHRLFANRTDPAAARPATTAATAQPLRNADTANISMALLGLPPVDGSYYTPLFADLLQLTRAGNSITLRWPSYLTGWTLESATDLKNGPWVADTGTPVEVEGSFRRTLSQPEGTSMFWRLSPPRP